MYVYIYIYTHTYVYIYTPIPGLRSVKFHENPRFITSGVPPIFGPQQPRARDALGAGALAVPC